MVSIRWVRNPLFLGALVVLSVSVFGGAADQDDRLPVQRLWELEERTGELENHLAKLSGQVELVKVAIDRIEKIVSPPVGSRVTGDDVGRVQELIRPMAEDLAKLKTDHQKLWLRMAALGQSQERQAFQNERSTMVHGGVVSDADHPVQDNIAISGEIAPNAHGPQTPPVAGLTHWLTNSSGVRHNAECDWYQKSNGKPAGPDEGRACTHCGG